MSTFEVVAPDGRTLEIIGVSMPTEQELDEIFNATGTNSPLMMRQSVMDSEDGKVYNVPVVMDGVDTDFAIQTQHKGADKGSFFGKVKTMASDAWDFTQYLGEGIEETIQSAERGVVGHLGQLTDTLLEKGYHYQDKVLLQQAAQRGDFSYWGEDIDENQKEEIRNRINQRVQWVEALRAKNAAFWNKGKEILRPEEEMDEMDRLMEGFGGAAVSIGEGIAATMATKSPTAAAALVGTLYGAIRNTEYFDKAKDSGMDAEDAIFNAKVAGIIEGSIELLGDRFLLGISKISPILKIRNSILSSAMVKAMQSKVGKSAVQKIGTRHANSIFASALKGFASEGGEEAAQQYLGMAWENYTGVSDYSDDEMLGETMFSFIVGGFPGAATATIGSSVYNRQTRNINSKIKDILKQQTPELSDQESQIMADSIQEMMFQESTGYVDEMNRIVQKELQPDTMPDGLTVDSLTVQTRKLLKEKYQMSDEDINKTIKASLGMIDARNQFNEAYSNFYEGLSAVGRSGNYADAEARILAARATTLARVEKTDVKNVLERWNLRFQNNMSREQAMREQFEIDLADEEFLDRAGVDIKSDSPEMVHKKISEYQKKLDDSIHYQGQIAENVINMPTVEEFNNPVKDYELLRLNESDLRKLGKEDKPVVLKKNIIEKNKRNHPEVDISEYDKILKDTLINTSEIIQVQPQKKPNYYTFINENQNDVSVVELSENKDNYEVVNFFKVNKKRIDEYRKKAVKDGGDIIITERKPQGAARLSALLNSDANNITPTRENVNKTLYQERQNPRGAYQRSNQESIVTLFENADASTVIHELGHFFLDDMRRFSDNETTKAQLEAIYKYVGSTDGKLTEDQHEYFANSFEVYLLDGRAPNTLLGKVFARFRKWIGGIWSEVRRLNGIKLSEDIRKTFDDMLGGRSLDFTMQVSGLKMAEALESGIIAPNVVSKAIRLLDEGKMSRTDMDGLIERLKSGELKRSDVNQELKKFENNNVTHHEALNPFDKMKYKSALQRGNFNKKDVVDKINRLLKWTELRTQGGKVVGRFPNLEMNRKFDHIRELMAMTKEDAREKIAENVKLINAMIRGEETGDMDSLVFDNKILSIPAKKADATLLLDVYNAISDSYNAGRLTTAITAEAKRQRKARMIGEAVDVLTNGGTVDWRKERGRVRQFINQLGTSQMSWNGLMDILSMNDKSSKSGQSALSRNLDVFEAEQVEALGVADDGEKASRLIEKGLSGTDNSGISLSRYVNEELKKETTIEWGNNRRTFTKDQLLDIWMKSQDQETRELMKNDEILQYNDAFLAEVNEVLTAKDRAVANAMFEFYDDNYQKINAFYEDKYGTSLGKRPFYSPRSMDRGGINVDTGDAVSYAGFSGVKQRTVKAGTVKIKGAFAVLQDYIVNSNHWIAWSDKLIDINGVMGDVKVKNIIRNLFGKKMESRIDYEVSRMASNDKFQKNWFGSEMLNKIRSNYAVSVLAVKPALMIKQLTSFPAYWEHMSTVEFMEGLKDFALHPKQAMETLGNTTLMKTRDVNIIKDFAELSKMEMFKKNTGKIKFRELMMLNIKLGDRGAIYIGGWALYKAELKKNMAAGMSEMEAKKKALEKFERVTDETQQSGRLSQQSYWQSNPMLRMFTMFQSSQNQYLRKEINAVRGLMTGRMDKAQAAKTLFIYHVLLPSLFQWASDGFDWDKKAQLRAVLLGSLNGIFLLNSVLEKGLDIALGTDDSWQATRLGLRDIFAPWATIEDIGAFFVKFAEDDVEVEDVMRAIKSFGELAGVPVKYPLDVIKNFGRYAEDGEYFKEVLLWLGWSPYALRERDAD